MKNKRLQFSVIFGQCILHQLPLVIIAFVHQIIKDKEITVFLYKIECHSCVLCPKIFVYASDILSYYQYNVERY